MVDTFEYRPGEDPGYEVAFDTMLSTDLFNHLVEHAPSLDKDEQATIKGVAQGYGNVYKAAGTLTKLFAPNPGLFNRTHSAAHRHTTFHTAMGPALLVWGMNQGWPDYHQYSQQMVEQWMEWCLSSRMSTNTMPAANLFMEQLTPLAPRIPEGLRERFLAKTLQEVYYYPNPWNNPQHAELSAHYLTLAYALGAWCPRELGRDGTSVEDCRRRNAALSMSELVNNEKRTRLVTLLATSELPLDELQRTFFQCRAEVWIVPCVQDVLVPILPLEERARFDGLHWSISPGAKHVNRELASRYCPGIFSPLELVVEPRDWARPDKIAALLLDPAAPPEMLALPSVFDEDTP